MNRIKPDEKGQALVEFVLILPVLVLIVFGFLQIYMDIHTADVASQAARAAARMVSAEGYADSGLATQVAERSFKNADVPMNSATITNSSCANGATPYTVTVTATPPDIVPSFLSFLDPQITEHATSVSEQKWLSGTNGPTSVQANSVMC